MSETNEILECIDKVIIKQSRDITGGNIFPERMADNIKALAELVAVRMFLYPTKIKEPDDTHNNKLVK